jgi:type VI protein secretion system component VasA
VQQVSSYSSGEDVLVSINRNDRSLAHENKREATNATATSYKEDQWIAFVNKHVRINAVSFRTLQVTALVLPGVDIRAMAVGVRFVPAII